MMMGATAEKGVEYLGWKKTLTKRNTLMDKFYKNCMNIWRKLVLDIVTSISGRDWRLICKLSKIHYVLCRSIGKFYSEQSSPISQRAKTTTSHCPNLFRHFRRQLGGVQSKYLFNLLFGIYFCAYIQLTTQILLHEQGRSKQGTIAHKILRRS